MLDIISNIILTAIIKRSLKRLKKRILKDPKNKRLYEEYRQKTATAIAKLSMY